MDRKGLLLPEYEKFIADAIFQNIKFPNKLAKWLSAPVLLKIIQMIDNWALDRLPAQVKDKIKPFIDAAFAGKLEEMRRLAADLGANYLDLKHVTKDTELYMVDSWTRVLVSHTIAYAEYREGQKALAAI